MGSGVEDFDGIYGLLNRSPWRGLSVSAAIAETHEVAREIPVTVGMKAAGAQELKVRSSGCLISPEYWAEKVYRAMAAVAPKTDASATWAFQQQRIAVAEAAAQHMRNIIAALEVENADLRDKLARKSEAAMRFSDDKDATIAALRAQIAAFTAQAQNVRPVLGESVTPTPNPFRDFLGDPRRIGGMS